MSTQAHSFMKDIEYFQDVFDKATGLRADVVVALQKYKDPYMLGLFRAGMRPPADLNLIRQELKAQNAMYEHQKGILTRVRDETDEAAKVLKSLLPADLDLDRAIEDIDWLVKDNLQIIKMMESHLSAYSPFPSTILSTTQEPGSPDEIMMIQKEKTDSTKDQEFLTKIFDGALGPQTSPPPEPKADPKAKKKAKEAPAGEQQQPPA